MEPRTFIDHVPFFVRLILVATWLVCSAIAFSMIGVLAGAVVLVGGAAGFALYRWAVPTRTITCDETGITVQSTSRRAGTRTKQARWSEVTELRCYEKEGGDEDSSSTQYFHVQTVEGDLLKLTSASNSFDGVVATVCEMTPHLPYAWVPRRQARDRDVIEKAGSYVKVTRAG